MITRLGHYDIVTELGRGGMGVVYKGYEPALGRFVAIKVLSPAMAEDPVSVERFLREARAMATLNDSHIIHIHFIGQNQGQTFFVMEYVEGEPLSTVLKREMRLPVGDALKILLQASQGLASAHSHGVVHRDVKPGNIMVSTRGQVKLTDFGIALAHQEQPSKLTTTGGFVGTPGYLSPEVCLGKVVDSRSDIFALGIVLYEMLSGATPFKDESPLKEMLDVVENQAPDIRQINADVDAVTAAILARMMAKLPADRFQSCEELNAELKRHPRVADERPLQLVVRAATGPVSNASTQVGTPALGTTGVRPPAGDAATLSARTPLPQADSHALPVTSPAITRVIHPRRRLNRLVLLGSALLAIALVVWLLERSASRPQVANTEAAAPGATRPLASVPAIPLAPNRSGPGAGHGGEHSTRNRVRAVATDAEPAESSPAKSHRVTPAPASRTRANAAGQPSALTRAHRRFLCRWFKKCSVPARKPASRK